MTYSDYWQTLEFLSSFRTSGIHQGITLIHYRDYILEWCLLGSEIPTFYSHINFFWVVYIWGAKINWKTKLNGLVLIYQIRALHLRSWKSRWKSKWRRKRAQLECSHSYLYVVVDTLTKRCSLTCGSVINNFKMSTEHHGDINNWERNHSRYSSVRKMLPTYHLFLKCLSSVVFMVHLIYECLV